MELPLAEIQGIIVTGYGHLPVSSYHFLRFTDVASARKWLGSLPVTNSDWRANGSVRKPEKAVNVAFTNNGLNFLRLPRESLQTFPQEFCEGMSEEHRARRLGDNGASAPSHWSFGGPANDEIHALLILEAKNHQELQSLGAVEAKRYGERAIQEATATIVGEMPCDSREHFGFRDSISQPAIAGAPSRARDEGDAICAGEFILGYVNEYGVLPPSPTVPVAIDRQGLLPSQSGEACRDFGRNGSFLVLRKMYQDVAAFNRLIAGLNDDPEDREWLAAKLVGRWRSGAPLVLSPNADNAKLERSNEFAFTPSDRCGFACPLGAHIRRANPRDSLVPDPVQSVRTVRRHRLLRRGVPFGPRLKADQTEDDKQDRGLLFICINADIQRQFEFVQQTWINDTKFNGLDNERDPLVGDNPEAREAADPSDGNMTIQGLPVRRRLNGLQRFVKLQGGGYFFVPSMAALTFLANLQIPAQ